MNPYALQTNHISEKLSKKLPPTDSRFRKDVKAWEHADLEKTSKEKSRLENNQRSRRNTLKEKFKKDKTFQQINGVEIDIKDERTYYQPKYFTKTVVDSTDKDKNKSDKETKKYVYRPSGNKYWEERDLGRWANAPKIFEDDC